MKTLYVLFAVAGLTLLAPAARAATPGTDAPTETARKATARGKATGAAKEAKVVSRTSARRSHKSKTSLSHSMLVLMGLEESKAVTSPGKRDWQLHLHQNRLRAKTRMEAKARRRRVANMLG